MSYLINIARASYSYSEMSLIIIAIFFSLIGSSEDRSIQVAKYIA